MVNGRFFRVFNPRIKELIETCWQKNHSKYSTFDKVFDLLTKDNRNLLEGVDVGQFRQYINEINSDKIVPKK